MGIKVRSSTPPRRAENGMALKIFTGAKPFLKAHINPFGAEMEMFPKTNNNE
jgi:hypothetical protein